MLLPCLTRSFPACTIGLRSVRAYSKPSRPPAGSTLTAPSTYLVHHRAVIRMDTDKQAPQKRTALLLHDIPQSVHHKLALRNKTGVHFGSYSETVGRGIANGHWLCESEGGCWANNLRRRLYQDPQRHTDAGICDLGAVRCSAGRGVVLGSTGRPRGFWRDSGFSLAVLSSSSTATPIRLPFASLACLLCRAA